ncbi:MAG TPA: glycosyltransferase [Actinomycetota bacterium]|nr:glycosyltransferase [Actinomycetota bacterium]
MSILFMLPFLNAPSELWMQRMIAALEPHISIIAAEPPMEPTWRGIPTMPITDQPASFVSRVAGKLAGASPPGAEGLIAKVANSKPIAKILVNYVELAVRFESVWLQTDKPLFVHAHGYDVTWDLRSHEEPSTNWFGDGYVDAVKRLSPRATFIANSQSTKSKLVEVGVPEDSVRVKYYGVPVPPAPRERKQNDSLAILFLGRLVDFKGPDHVIRAFELACDDGLRGHLTLAGDGPMRETCEILRAKSKYKDRVRLVGSVDLDGGQALRSRADIFTMHNQTGPLTRQEEALGVVILEAMADALPIISTRNGALPETVIEGETGILVEPGDIRAHADALLLLAGDPRLRAELGRAGWERAGKHFSAERERDRLLEILGITSRP